MEEFDSAPVSTQKDELTAGGDVGNGIDPLAAKIDFVSEEPVLVAEPVTSPPEAELVTSLPEPVTSPIAEEPDSSFVDTKEPMPTPSTKREVVEEEEEEDEVDPVSSSTPVASKASPRIEDIECVEDGAGDGAKMFACLESAALENYLPPVVVDLIYWRQPWTTGAVFSSLFILLVSFSIFSAISVISHLALGFLIVIGSFVTFKRVAAAVQKTGEGHPFQAWLERDVEELIPGMEDVKPVVEVFVTHLTGTLDVLRSLFLIVHFFDSLKFVTFLYALTYVGDAFNLLTLVIILFVAVFTIPKVYEMYGGEIDSVLEKVVAQAKAQWPVVRENVIDKIVLIKTKIIAAIPIGKEKAS